MLYYYGIKVLRKIRRYKLQSSMQQVGLWVNFRKFRVYTQGRPYVLSISEQLHRPSTMDIFLVQCCTLYGNATHIANAKYRTSLGKKGTIWSALVNKVSDSINYHYIHGAGVKCGLRDAGCGESKQVWSAGRYGAGWTCGVTCKVRNAGWRRYVTCLVYSSV